jgi:hypothetical protein
VGDDLLTEGVIALTDFRKLNDAFCSDQLFSTFTVIIVASDESTIEL